jgi:hypothetical protein
MATRNLKIFFSLVLVLAVFIFSFKFYIDELVLKESLTSVSGDAAIGTISLQIISPGLCIIQLADEWNFVSFCANPANKSINSILSSIQGDYDYILRWNYSAQTYDVWSTYSSQNPYDFIDLNKSHFIYATTSDLQLSINGSQNQDVNLSLTQNWTTPNYPYEFGSNITKSLESIEGQYNYILKWNSTAQSYLVYSIFSSSNPFENISAGEGQFIYINDTSALLEYDRSALGG